MQHTLCTRRFAVWLKPAVAPVAALCLTLVPVSQPLADDSASRIVKRFAARVGLDVSTFSGHSLRSGFLTSAAESGANIFKMAEVSRHRSLDTLRGYVRRVDLFKEHAGAAFL